MCSNKQKKYFTISSVQVREVDRMLTTISFLGFFACLIWLVVSFVKKWAKKYPIIAMLVCVVTFCVAAIMQPNTEPSASETSTNTSAAEETTEKSSSETENASSSSTGIPEITGFHANEANNNKIDNIGYREFLAIELSKTTYADIQKMSSDKDLKFDKRRADGVSSQLAFGFYTKDAQQVDRNLMGADEKQKQLDNESKQKGIVTAKHLHDVNTLRYFFDNIHVINNVDDKYNQAMKYRESNGDNMVALSLDKKAPNKWYTYKDLVNLFGDSGYLLDDSFYVFDELKVGPAYFDGTIDMAKEFEKKDKHLHLAIEKRIVWFAKDKKGEKMYIQADVDWLDGLTGNDYKIKELRFILYDFQVPVQMSKLE